MQREALTAFETGDRQRASLLILRDQKIDQMQRQIDRLCLEFLVRHQPAGTHLRFVYATVLVNFELERVGDYAESLARQTLKLADLGYRAPAGLLEDIAPASIAMLQNAVTAFVRQDADLANATAQVEEQIDQLRNQANSELLHLVQTGHLPLAALTPLMTMARRFERVSDQAKSICQEAIYICTGEYAMHPANYLYRVLFVDQDHGASSRMAEAIGRNLHRSDFEFDSAGLDPQPMPPALGAYLREQGLPTLNPEARAARNVQDYQG
jgi:phosphate transport system protein